MSGHDLPIIICAQPNITGAPRSLPIHASEHPNIPFVFLDALSIRIAVFVEEQDVPAENELDEYDALSHHVVLYTSEDNPSGSEAGLPICTLRFTEVVPDQEEFVRQSSFSSAQGEASTTLAQEGIKSFEPGANPLKEPLHLPSELWDGKEPHIRLGRMATSKAYRKKGMAQALMSWTFGWILGNQKMFSCRPTFPVLVHAQREVQAFYARQGFVLDMGMGIWIEEGIEHVGMWKRLSREDSQEA